MSGLPKLTATQRRIIAVLQDGRSHTREELRSCIHDELAENSTFRTHLYKLRKKLRQNGYAIFSEMCSHKMHYRLVPPENEE